MKLITIKTHPEFKVILNNGLKIVKKTFVLFYIKKSDNCFGFIASRKHFRKAVERNRAKRRIRAALYQVLNEQKLKILMSSHCVFILRKSILNADFKDLLGELQTLVVSVEKHDMRQ